MLSITIDEKNNIVILEPDGALSKTDFISASAAIDPIIIKHGQLNGLIIHTKHFPGWDSFAALISHLKFIKNHHQKISYIAIDMLHNKKLPVDFYQKYLFPSDLPYIPSNNR